MPSKGITVYSYISIDVEGYEVEFTVPKDVVRNTAADNFTSRNLEMRSSNIQGSHTYTGRFEWTVYDPSGTVIGTRFNNINSLTGNLEGGNLTSTAEFKPIVTESVIITYGFYDAGHGEAGLPYRDQCYVTICSTANRSWMGSVAPPGSPQAQLPFSRFVLAAPHDNGMNSMQSANAVLSSIDKDMTAHLRNIFPALHSFSHVPDERLLHMLPDIVYGVAITQKKDIGTMLALGARYFEFRPAELLPMFQKVSKLPNKFYFHHACIPGLAFDDFLDAQVAFLDANPTEMVTIHIRYDNIVKECKRPTDEQIHQMLDEACRKAKKEDSPLLTWAPHDHFSRPIDQLRSAGQRLVVAIMADKYDSWTADAYATLEAGPILARFESMDTAGQEATDLTVLQCQATSQSIKEVLVYSVLSADAATSCLSGTKGALDMETLPWIRANALDRLKAERNLVVMNDFIDGATADTSVELSRRRLWGDEGLVSRFSRALSIGEGLEKEKSDAKGMPGSFC